MDTPRRHRRKAMNSKIKRRRWAVALSIVALSLATLATASVGYSLITSALSAKSALERALPLVVEIRSDLVSRRVTEASEKVATVQDLASEARQATDYPLWRSFEWVPVLGANLEAVRTSATVAADLVDEVLQPITQVNFDELLTLENGVNLTAFAKASQILSASQTSIATADAKLAHLATDQLFDPVREAVHDLRDMVTSAEKLIVPSKQVADILPAILGAPSPRSYLLMFQGNSESRSLGGNPAALLLANVNNGKFQIAAQASSSDFHNDRDFPIIDLDPEAVAIYGDKIGKWLPDITMVPDFPYSARLLQAYWAEEFGGSIDGVLSFDPVALSYILEVVGSITLPDGLVLTSENAVPLLLNEIYFMYEDPKEQNAFFAAAAGATFQRLTAGDLNVAALFPALLRAVNEGRLMYSPANPTEAELISGTRLAGTLPKDNVTETTIGVFVNDNTTSKKDYYLDLAVTASKRCSAKESTVAGKVLLDSSFTAEIADSIPYYIQGRVFPRELISTYLVLYGPVGSSLTSVTLDGAPAPILSSGQHLGRPAVKIDVMTILDADHEVGFEFAFTDKLSGPLNVRTTPMVRQTTSTVEDHGC